MPFVVTAVPSGGDGSGQVEAVLGRLGQLPAVRPFARVGDGELQGVLADPTAVVDVVLGLVRAPGWTVGVGAGPVLDGGRPGGPALLSGRRAADAAGQRGTRLAVRGAVPPEAADAQAVLTALAVVVQRRSPQAWEAIELVAGGRTQARAAAALGISRQAVGQRLAAGLWELERELRPTAARLLTRAEG
ncbi:hypothetical protein ACI784_13820 [Geodermatophilus sp. SYSU D01186]